MNSPAIWRAVYVHDRTGCHRSSLYFWGHHIFFLRAPPSACNWMGHRFLFVCLFVSQQSRISSSNAVGFFFLPFMLICLMQIQCQLMIGDSHWLGSSLPHSLGHESTSECKRKTIFFLHYLVSIDTARPHSEFDMTPKRNIIAKFVFYCRLSKQTNFSSKNTSNLL